MRSSVEGKTYETNNLLFGGTRGATNITMNGEAKDNDDEGRQATALARYSGVIHPHCRAIDGCRFVLLCTADPQSSTFRCSPPSSPRPALAFLGSLADLPTYVWGLSCRIL